MNKLTATTAINLIGNVLDNTADVGKPEQTAIVTTDFLYELQELLLTVEREQRGENMNTFIKDNFNRIFNTNWNDEIIQEKEEKGSTSEKLILKVLNDMFYGTDNISYNQLWSVLSADMLQKLADTPHIF